jgi:hypothetical protein
MDCRGGPRASRAGLNSWDLEDFPLNRQTPDPLRSLGVPQRAAPNDWGAVLAVMPACQAGALSPSQNGYFTLDYFPPKLAYGEGSKPVPLSTDPPLAGGLGESLSAVPLPPPLHCSPLYPIVRTDSETNETRDQG